MAPTEPLIFVLHGARGDLAKRMVLPALATLQRRHLLPGSGELKVTTTVKRPGAFLDLATGTADLALSDVEPGESLPPYAGLLEDVLVGDRTLFTTATGLESAWKAFAPLQGNDRPDPEPYAVGSWGPDSADRLAEPHGWALGD